MKAIILLSVVVAAVSADLSCYQQADEACKATDKHAMDLRNCNAVYGGFSDGTLLQDLQRYATAHIKRSFDYLLMSTHYGNYEKNREGFEKLFRKYSDAKWDDAIDIIKYISKRGGKMDFTKEPIVKEESVPELDELQSVAKALDIEKKLATEVQNMHPYKHDLEAGHYLEEKFAEKLSGNVRALSGHVNDLKKLLGSTHDHSLALYLFDEYLEKL